MLRAAFVKHTASIPGPLSVVVVLGNNKPEAGRQVMKKPQNPESRPVAGPGVLCPLAALRWQIYLKVYFSYHDQAHDSLCLLPVTCMPFHASGTSSLN